MSRLQKKCLIATAGLHLLLVLVVLFGSAFFVSHHKPDDAHILTAIPSTLIDRAMESGVVGAQPPPSAPPQPPQPPQLTQPAPQPPVTQVQPTPEPPKPQPTLTERVEKLFKPDPPKNDPQPDEPEPKLTKSAPKKIQVSLDPVVRNSTKPTTDNSATEARREAQRLADQRARAFRTAMTSISKNASTATEVDMPGASSAAYANYKDALASIYYDAWTPPADASNNDAVTKVKIVIARDGSIISARIINGSGDFPVDASVQRAIDRVKNVPPLPEGAKESQRTVILNFNLKTKRMIG